MKVQKSVAGTAKNRRPDLTRTVPPYEYRELGGIRARVFIDRFGYIYRAESAGESAGLGLRWKAEKR